MGTSLRRKIDQQENISEFMDDRIYLRGESYFEGVLPGKLIAAGFGEENHPRCVPLWETSAEDVQIMTSNN